MGEPDELGSFVAFLASEEAEYLTGQIIVFDGGRIMQ
jgi:3-oxoacyl-[acyl-carrier protein] reductase